MRSLSTEKINYYLLILWAAILPSGFYAANFTVSILLLISSFTVKRPFGDRLKSGKVLFPALIYFLVVIGFFFANNRREATSTLSVYFPYLIVPIAVSISNPINEEKLRNVYRAFILSLFLSLLACDIYNLVDIFITGKLNVLVNDLYHYRKLTSFGLTRLFEDYHPTYVAAFIIWSLLILVQERQGVALFSPFLRSVLISTLLLNLFLLNSIAALLAFALVGIIWAIQTMSKRGMGWGSITLITIFFLTATVAVAYLNPLKNSKIATLEERGFKITDAEGERNFLTIRLAKWLVHYDIFKKHAVVGVTAGDIKDTRRQAYADHGFTRLAEMNYNAHNEYLEMLSRFGFIGFIIFLCLLISPINWRRMELYEYFILSCAVIFLTESFLERQQGLFSFLFFYALLSMRRSQSNESTLTQG